jgi:hypothetical protein
LVLQENLLHLYAQDELHDPVVVVGDKKALNGLKEEVDRTLTGLDGEGDRRGDKNCSQHPGDFGQKGDRTPRAKGRLTGPPESRRDVHVFAALEEHSSDQQDAYKNV